MSNSEWNEDQAVGEAALRKAQHVYDAAPEMLAALESVAQWCHQGHGNYPAKNCGLCRPVFEAIKKAKGRKD